MRARPPLRSLLRCTGHSTAPLLVAPLLVATLLVATLGSHAAAQAASPLGWSGWVRCDVGVRGPGYSDQQTHTWTMAGGTPTAEGAFRIYPATWSVVGGGALERTEGTQTRVAEWATNVSSMSAPIAVFVRASDGRMLIQARHAQLRAPGAIAGYQQLTIDGKVQRPSTLALEAFEWTFPVIELAPAAGTASGSRAQPTTGSPGPMQPAGSEGTASCSWQFGQGASAPAPPPTLVARAAPVPKDPNASTTRTDVAITPIPGAATPTPGSAAPADPAAPPPARLDAVRPTACAMPGPAVRAVATSSASIDVSWSAVPGAVGYTVTRSDVGALAEVGASTTPLRFSHRANLDYRVAYTYAVQARYATGCGIGQATVTPPRPGTPTIVRLAALDGDVTRKRGSVRIEWRMPDTTITGFLVLGPGLGTEGAEVRPRAAFATGPSVPFGLDVADVPAGEQSWLVAPFWEVPGGRVIDVGTGAKASGTFGVYNIVITGVRAVHQTFDDPLDVDGKGDEIYVAAAAYVSGHYVGMTRSPVYGDVGPPSPIVALVPNPPSRAGRLLGGTATPQGGVQTNDFVTGTAAPSRAALPLIVWTGWLGGSKEVRINPSIWEYDGTPTLFAEWATMTVASSGGGASVQPPESTLMDAVLKMMAERSKTASAINESGSGGGSTGSASSTSSAAQTGTPQSGTQKTAVSPAPPQIPPFLLAGQQGWDRYIGDVTVDAPLAFSANGVTSGTKTAPMVATIVFKDAPGTVLNRYDGEYVLVIGILAAP